MGLCIGFLVVSTGTRASDLFGFAATGYSYQHGLVIVDENVFDLFLRSLIHVFLLTGPYGFGDTLVDCINLSQ